MRIQPQRGVLTPAQGNALGKLFESGLALKGDLTFRALLQGFPSCESYFQGVALGYLGSPLWGYYLCIYL